MLPELWNPFFSLLKSEELDLSSPKLKLSFLSQGKTVKPLKFLNVLVKKSKLNEPNNKHLL